MLSDYYFKILGAHILRSNKLWGSPFMWDEKNKRLTTNPVLYRKFLFSCAIVFLYSMFVLIRATFYVTTTGIFLKNADMAYIHLYMYCGAAILICTIFPIALAKAEEIAHFFTESLKFFQNFQEQHIVPLVPHKQRRYYLPGYKLMDAVISFVGIAYPALGLLLGLHSFVFPHWPSYPTSLIPVEYRHFSIVLGFGVFWFWGVQMIYSTLLIATHFVLVYARCLFTILQILLYQETNGRLRRSETASNKLKNCKSLALAALYRQSELVHLHASEIVSTPLVIIYVVFTGLGVLCNSSVIKQWRTMHGVNLTLVCAWSVIAMTTNLLLLTFGAKYFDLSSSVLQSWKRKDWGSRAKSVQMKMFARCRKPMSFGYGRVFVIQRASVLKFLKRLTRSTLRALLTIR